MVPTGPACVTRLPPHRCRRPHRTAPYRPLDSPTGCHCERHHWRTAPRRLHDWCRLRHAFGPRRGGPRGGRRRAGHAVHEYRDGVIERRAARRRTAAAARLGAAGSPGLARRAAHRGAAGGARRAASTRPTSSASAPTSPRARCCPPLRDGTPLCEAAGVARPARTRGRSCGSTTRRSRRPTGSTRSRTSAASSGSAGTAAGSQSEWQFAKALQVLEEDPEIYRRRRPLDRGGRLDRLAAVRPGDPQRLHRRLQGRSSRTGAIRRPDYLAALNPRLRRLRADPAGPSAVTARHQSRRR